jgi:ribosomal protein S27AE
MESEERFCRRCGSVFETAEESDQAVCDQCLYLDWHEFDNELEEGEDID